MRAACMFTVRWLTIVLFLGTCLIIATLAPCFIGAHLIASSAIWRYFAIAALASLLAVLAT